MPTTIVRIYRSVVGAGQIQSFDIQVQGQQFFLSPAQPGLAPIDWISRVDFLDPDGNILLVVPCFPPDSTIYLANGGQVFQFRLELRNFLGGALIVFQTDLQSYQRPDGSVGIPFTPQIAPCLPDHSAAPQPGFQLAGKATNPPGAAWSTDLSYYVSVIQDLPGYNSFDDSFRVDAPQDATFDPAVSSRPLYSQHTSVLVRRLRTKDTAQPLPVLCPRRAYQQGQNDPAGAVPLPPPFSFPLPIVGDNSAAAHVSQFPAISWFNSTTSAQPMPLPEADIWHFETSAIPFDCVKDLWQNNVLTPYIMGLRVINAPQPVSLAAWINWDANPVVQGDNTWRLFRTAWLKPINKQGQRLLLPLSERLLPGGYLDSDVKNAQPASWNLTGEFPGFRTHNGTSLQFSAETMPFANGDLSNPANDEQGTNDLLKHPPTRLTPFSSMLFGLRGVTLTSAAPARVRLGSLDLTFGSWSQTDLQQNSDFDKFTFRVDFDPPASHYAELVQPGGFTPRLYVHGILPVNSYAPGGQDELADGDEFELTAAPGTGSNRSKFVRSQPIVIDASLVGASPTSLQLAPASYKLQFDERTLPSPQQQQLVLNLQQLTSGDGSAAAPTTPRVLVLDREPFLVAFISLQAPPNAAPSTDPSLANNVGVWCNLYPEGAGWRLQAGSGGFNLYLPPQAVGEAMVRGFLVDDPITEEDTASHTFPTPDQSPIDYRFSPLLSARLHANYFAQNAVEPGWNTRRVLGSANQQLPGALVDDKNGGVTFELLYGMTAGVTQPNLRLSEIFARLGNFPGPLPDPSGQSSFALPFTTEQTGVYNQASDDWANLYSQLLRRLGALELWDDHQGPDVVIDENVDFTLRDVSLNFPPSFNGTLAYAIQSANIVAELAVEPNSVAGQLNSPRFTALGGYGAQRAEFASGKVIIDTRTSMGRIESLTITLVGRIGNLWNHALHVTVYARTALPSDQFALYQDQLYNRPLLRKTEEYVLITEAQRSYPENSIADPALTGFVLGSNFKSTKINVDSRWGGDVGKIGWQVPLWKKGALPEIAYPRPHIALKVAVDPATGSSAVLSEIDDPEKLCFYTDTQIGTPTQPAPSADTDTWAVVPEIDWIDQPAMPPSGTGAAFQDPSVEPGFGRFTYHFTDEPAQVNLVAQRTSTAVAAKLRNVSMIRGARSANAADSSLTNTQRIRRVTDWWSVARAYMENAADDADAVYASANDLANDAGQAASNALISTGVTDPNALKAAAADAINNSLAASKVNATKKLNDALVEVQKTYLGNPTTQSVAAELTSLASFPSTTCDAVKVRLDNVLNRVDGQKQLMVQTVLQGYLNQLQQELAKTQSDVAADLLAAMTITINAVATEIESALSPVSGDVQGVVQKITAYQKAAFDPAIGFVAKLTALSNGLASAAATFDQATAQALVATLQQVIPGSPIRTALEQGAAVVDAATNVFLGGRGTSVLLAIDGAFDALMVQLMGQLNPIPFPGPGPQGLIALAGIAVGKLNTAINTAQQACANAIASLNQLTPSPLNQMVEQLKGTLILSITAEVGAGTQAMHDAADQFLATYVSGPATAAANWVNSFVTGQETWIQNSASSLCQSLQQAFGTLVNDLKNMALTEISSLLSGFVPADFVSANGFRNALSSISNQFENQLQQVAQSATQEVESVTSGANAASLAAALRVIRAFGDPPQVPTMDFLVPQIPLPNIEDISLPAMAYCFNEALPTVDMTPARAVVQQVADGLGSLSQLGVNLPTKQMLDRLLPDSLQNFDFTSILPHFAGIDLTSLLSGIQMPSVANDTVHITHHVDPQNRRASLDADINVPLAGNSTLFDLGPVELRLVGATFTAQVHCEVAVGQQVQQTSSGQIYGDWELLICGMSVVGFTKTTLSFDSSGKVHFDIKPANVRLSEVLQFLADLVNSLNLGIGGFTVHMTTTPIAVQCILDLPIPDMSAGAFGIQNLRLGATFELGYDESFYLSVAANLARETAPFILTVFILGGAGWIEAAVRYQDGKITGLITIGLAASASLAIALGPISGSVSIDFGIFARLAIGDTGGFQLGIMLLIDGRVSILGFIEANISLLLEAEYSSGGGLIGRGVVSVSIKICWCFTLEVHTGVQYSFGSAGSSKGAQAPQPQTRVAAAVVAPAALEAIGAPAAQAPPDPYIPYRNAAVQYVTMLA